MIDKGHRGTLVLYAHTLPPRIIAVKVTIASAPADAVLTPSCVSCRFVPTRILRSCLKQRLGCNLPIQTIGLQVGDGGESTKWGVVVYDVGVDETRSTAAGAAMGPGR